MSVHINVIHVTWAEARAHHIRHKATNLLVNFIDSLPEFNDPLASWRVGYGCFGFLGAELLEIFNLGMRYPSEYGSKDDDTDRNG